MLSCRPAQAARLRDSGPGGSRSSRAPTDRRYVKICSRVSSRRAVVTSRVPSALNDSGDVPVIMQRPGIALRGRACRPDGRAAGRQAPDGPEACSSDLARVVVPLAAVEVARAHAAALESATPSRTDRGRSGRASQPAPCRRGQHGTRAEPSSRTGIPLLRLPVGSKGGEVSQKWGSPSAGDGLRPIGRKRRLDGQRGGAIDQHRTPPGIEAPGREGSPPPCPASLTSGWAPGDSVKSQDSNVSLGTGDSSDAAGRSTSGSSGSRHALIYRFRRRAKVGLLGPGRRLVISSGAASLQSDLRSAAGA